VFLTWKKLQNEVYLLDKIKHIKKSQYCAHGLLIIFVRYEQNPHLVNSFFKFFYFSQVMLDAKLRLRSTKHLPSCHDILMIHA
jgi:hypothetical protein